MIKTTWTITLSITIIIIFHLGIGGYAMLNSTDFRYRFYGELKDWLKIETEINKGQTK